MPVLICWELKYLYWEPDQLPLAASIDDDNVSIGRNTVIDIYTELDAHIDWTWIEGAKTTVQINLKKVDSQFWT